jgi:hypothetical protein
MQKYRQGITSHNSQISRQNKMQLDSVFFVYESLVQYNKKKCIVVLLQSVTVAKTVCLPQHGQQN